MELSVKAGLERRIEAQKDLVRRGVGSGVFRDPPVRAWQAAQVRLMRPVDTVDRVENRCVHDRETAGRVNRRRLSAVRPNNHQESSIPLHYWIDPLVGSVICGMAPIFMRSGWASG